MLEKRQAEPLEVLCQTIVKAQLDSTRILLSKPTLSRYKRGDHMICNRVDCSEIVTAVSQCLPIHTITSDRQRRIDFASTIRL